ncbi:MAG: GntR family transcriptional regulator [Verrucomicrobia bacterium]|nr:GntR family transcriptional regulator [Verrucomicrobiota bacterium]
MKKPANSDVAYDYIRKCILSGEYAQGQPLLESVLAEKIGVSRTPVREALRQLEAEGLVTIRGRLGAAVKSMAIREFREMCEVRQSLESSAAGLAALHHSEADLETIRHALESMAKLTEKIAAGDQEQHALLAEVIREDIRFHVAILSAARNNLMKQEVLRLHLIKRIVSGITTGSPASIFPEWTRLRPGPGEKAKRDARRFESLASHKVIYEAIAKGDAAAAKSAMEQHIQEIIELSLLAMARADSAPSTNDPNDDDLKYMG